ncbi:RF-1 domain-containing protein [Sparassis latifolia]
MSVSPALLTSARSAYRTLLRASSATFAGDPEVAQAFRTKIRSEILTYPPPEDAKVFEGKISLVQEIADVLRKNIVQAVKLDDGTEDGSAARFKIRFTEHTELGSNDSVKRPHQEESSRSARKRQQTCCSAVAAEGTKESDAAPRVPRYYSQLKKASKQRVVPELKEEDLEESFVRGSGPGGQSINKTENNVQLLHKPTGFRVSCQETRSLLQNRKLARRVLLDKLDAMYNPGLSKQELKRALQIERERRRKKKAKQKAASE